MSKYALIVDDFDPAGGYAKVVREVFQTNPGMPEGMDVREVDDAVQIGWIAKGTVIGPYVAPPLTKDDLIAYANATQWARATGGRVVNVGGQQIFFSTDEAGYSLISGKAQRLQRPNAPATTMWQADATTFYTIQTPDFLEAAEEVADFMQATFDALPALIEKIQDGTVTTKQQIDAVFAAI